LKPPTPGLLVFAAATVAAVACGSNPASPGNTQAVSNFIASAMAAAGGPAAVQETGAPPAATGGPSVTVTGSATVTDGGLSLVNVSGGTPFQTVFIAIGGTSSNVGGFYRLQLQTPTTSADVVQALAGTIPTSSFQVNYSVGTASGAVGQSTSLNNTVQTTAPAVSVTGTWSGSVSLQSQPTSQFTLVLTETGAQVTGSFTVSKNGLAKLSGNAFGSVTGTTFAFASARFVNSSGCTQQVSNGTMQVSGTTMQGTATLLGIANCGPQDSGTLQFTLTKQ
jgi:hypothetical protein